MHICSCLFNLRKITKKQKLQVHENMPDLHWTNAILSTITTEWSCSFRADPESILCQKFNQLNVFKIFFLLNFSSTFLRFLTRVNITSPTENSAADQRPPCHRIGNRQQPGSYRSIFRLMIFGAHLTALWRKPGSPSAPKTNQGTGVVWAIVTTEDAMKKIPVVWKWVKS